MSRMCFIRRTVQLDPATLVQLEAAQKLRAVGSARPPIAAVLREAIERGLPLVLGASAPASPEAA